MNTNSSIPFVNINPSIVFNNNIKDFKISLYKKKSHINHILEQLSSSSEYFCDSVDMGDVAGDNLSIVFSFEKGEDMIPQTDDKVTITFYHGDSIVAEASGTHLMDISSIKLNTGFKLERQLSSLIFKMTKGSL